MTLEIRFLTIPEADTLRVTKAIVQVGELPRGSRIRRVKDMAPWQPDGACVYQPWTTVPAVTVSRLYIQTGDNYEPTDGYLISGESNRVNFEQIMDEEISRQVRKNNRSPIDRVRDFLLIARRI